MNSTQHAMPPSMRDGVHRYELRVYVEDTDAGGIVYHANYLRYAERGRSEALRELGLPHAEMIRSHGRMFVVRRAKIDYERPARLDDWLIVETRSRALTAATVTLEQTIRRRDGTTLARVDLLLACVMTGNKRATRLPAALRNALAAMRDAGQDDRREKGLVSTGGTTALEGM